jgi:hypothetical protein
MKGPLPDSPADLGALMAEVGKCWTVNRSANIALILERFTSGTRPALTETHWKKASSLV